ncbi:MAG: N-acetylmuramoyl-L-alanine amidase [Pseudonocardiales bacterium]|nr:N-acetylmuramoyl-L-alanine amidase [Pseudonocardiales bacterium]
MTFRWHTTQQASPITAWTPPAVLVQVLLCCLVPLAACGTIPPSSAPAVWLPSQSPRATPAAASVGSAPSETPNKITVVLDPGHNGANAEYPAKINRQVPNGRGGTKACDTTGTSTEAGYPEHAFAWDVALRVRDALVARGVQVVLTRPDDAGVGPCVNDRAAIANQAGARAKVSIHADGAAPSGHGFHVAYADPPVHPSQGSPSIALATALVRALRAGGFPAANYIGSGGLYPRSDLAGLNLSQIPAVLLECANMRNPQEAALVSTPAGRARYAAAITEGIMAWLTSR